MKHRIHLILLSLVCLIVVNSCATTDEGEIQAKYLEEKIHENPHIIELYMYLIDYHWNENADLREALRIANECVRNNANKPKAHLLAAQTLFNTGFTKAGEDFLRRRIAEQKNFDALLMLSSKLREQGKFNDARSLLTNALAFENTENENLKKLSDADATNLELINLELARLDFIERKYDSALKTLNELVNNSSNMHVVNASAVLLMRVYVQTKDFEQIEDLTKLMFDKPKLTSEFIEVLTYAYVYNKKHHELANKLVKFYKKTQDVELKQTIMFQLVLNEILRDKIDDALQYLKLGLELKPVFSPFLVFDYYLSIYKSKEKDFDETEARRETLISYDLQYFEAPESFENFKAILYGNLLRYLGFYDLAKDAYNKILETEPESSWTMLALAELALDQKNFTDAVFWYFKVNSTGMQNADLYCQIGDCQLKSGEYDKAIDAFELAQNQYPGSIRAKKGIEIARVLKGDRKLESAYPYIFPLD